MYFKSLEIFGFKSFANKTLIQFEPGVTAIVGPNGCGKSNVSDSIRWVLGEQSAKSLRGASMEDVIFNGSSAKEPVNFAEVSLTLSNTSRLLPIDYEEVTITRRLYRSGESEYMINRNQVRLRDIHEMLMGTGIGTESYSIIEQGKMDVVLSAKPEDRREIFEEAAGITKFKAKKREALRKLEQTDSNLLRVNDIIQEVKRQIGSVERQAKKAESYKAEFEKLKKLEVALASREFLGFQTRRSTKEEELAALREKEREYAALFQDAEEQCRLLREEISQIDEDLKGADIEEVSISSDIRKNQDRVLLNRERIGELAERRENLSRQVDLAERRAQEFRREFERLDAEYALLASEEAAGKVFLESVEAEFASIEAAIAQAASEEEASKAALAALAEGRARIQNDLAKVNAELASLAARSRRMRQDEESLNEEDARAEAALRAAATAVAEREGLLAAVTERRQEAKRAQSAAEEASRAADTAASEASAKLSSARSRLQVMKDLRDRHEGFWGGVKAILDHQPSSSGTIGLLADLVSADAGYELAVEAALENYLQAVVFRADEDVLAAADFLRSAGKGRALLLSLSSEQQAEPQAPQAVPAESVLSRIKSGQEMSGFLRGLVGRVYVAEDARGAFALSRQHPDLVFVTRDGERFEGRAVTGGSLSSNADSALVGRQARVEEAAAAESALQRDLEHRESEAERLRIAALESVRAADALDEESLGLQVALSEEKAQWRQADEARRRALTELEILRGEIAQLAAQQSAYLADEKSLNEDSFRTGEEEKRLSEAVLNFRAAAREKGSEKEGLLVKLAETRSRQEHRTAKREKIEKDKSWVLESIANEESQAAFHRKDIEEAVRRREALEQENWALEEESSKLSLRRDELLRTTENTRRQRQERQDALAEQEIGRDEKAAFLRDARERAHAFELESTEIRFEIDRLHERILNAYQIDLHVQDALAEFGQAAMEILSADEERLAAAKEDIRALRDKLAKMGPVNLVAIDEFNEMRERYDFLTKQHEDLIKAKEDLQEAIRKINRTTKELFVDTFEKVKVNFSEYFKLLFGGGHAELVLLDAEDVLESGIEIIARPPGKKLQSITLLSGGEKALTAVALMFSLFKVKPSPFCILDEIDAPLDETNVERFLNVLKDFITGSQFILITHNKRTMNLADAMYGVTMEQTGISKIVSVKFQESNARGVSPRAEIQV